MTALHPYGIDGHGQLIYSNSSFGLTTSAQTVVPRSAWAGESGPYLISCKISANPWYSETWSGLMQWYSSTTNSNDATDIYLTGSGHATNSQVLYARFKRFGGNNNNHGLQVWSNGNSTVNFQVWAFQLSDQAH